MGNCLPSNNQVVPNPILNSAETAAETAEKADTKAERQTVKIKTYLDTAEDLNPESLFSIYLLPIKIASLLYNHDNSYGKVIEKYCSFGCDTFYSMKTTDIVYLCFKGSKNPADYCGHAVCHHLTVKNPKYLCIKNDNIYLYLTDYTEVDLSNILFEIQILDTVNNIKNENKIPGIGTSILTFLKLFKQQSIYLRSVSAAYTFYVKNGFFSAIYSNDNPINIKEFPILWKLDEPSPSEDLTKYKFYYKGRKYDDKEQAYLYTKQYPYILNWSENSLIPCIYKLIKRGGRNRRILKLNNMY